MSLTVAWMRRSVIAMDTTSEVVDVRLASQDAALASHVEKIRAAVLPKPAARRRIRTRTGTSLREMAQLLGVNPMTVQRWEHGTAVPSPANAARYRKVLDALAELAQ